MISAAHLKIMRTYTARFCKDAASIDKILVEDLTDIKKKLALYLDKGQITSFSEVSKELVVAAKPDTAKIKTLQKMVDQGGRFLAVDCSRTMKRANNWGVHLMRVAYILVKEKQTDCVKP